MDFKGKGITWVGNIYHKFEAIRSEVGDMSKETAKYVENQVQGVGVNVKKICAGVMHDFIPSSSVDLVKEEGSDSGNCKESMTALDDNPISESVPHKVSEITADMVKGSTPVSFSTRVPENNENSDLGTCKESMAALDDNPMSESVPHNVSKITADMVKGSTPVSFSTGAPDNNHLLPPPPVSSVKDVGLDCCLEKIDDNEDILTMENIETSEIVEITVPMVQDSSQASFLEGVYDIDDLFPSSSVSPVKDVGPEFLLEQNDDFYERNKSKTAIEKDDVKVDPPQISEVVDPAVEVQSPVFGTQTEMSPETSVDVMIETFCQNGGDIHNETLDQTGHVNDTSTALSSSMFVPSFSCENQVVETGSAPFNSFPTEPNGMGTLTTFEASKNDFEQDKELEAVNSPAEIGIQGRYGDSTVEFDEGDEALDMEKETIDKFDNVELEDSCILVLSKEFFSVPTRKSHHRSYKKKIRDAFASRMRTGKKKEYELLAMWYADIDAGADQQRPENAIPSTLFRTLDSKSLPTDDSCGSDWEIL